MASVHKKNKNSWGVTYSNTDSNGKSRQKEETFRSEKEAEERGREVEYLKSKGLFIPPVEKTVEQFLHDSINLYGAVKWSPSTYATNEGSIRNYIIPSIGNLKMRQLTTKKMDEFFGGLHGTQKVSVCGRPSKGVVSNRMIKEMHVLLTTAFNKAVEWGDLPKNPITKSSRPEVQKKEVSILEPAQTKYFISKCDDLRLLACSYLALGCSMRIGEVLGLQWANVNFGDEENNFDDAKLHVRQELQRVNLTILSKIKARREDIFFLFPEIKKNAVSRLVLKTPKTKGSVRTVWIPPTVCHLLKRIEKIQADHQFALGESYEDYDLVISRFNGRPVEEGRISDILQEQLQKAGLHHVTFHSFRHTSTTIKLLITNGDIKGVQGDNGQTVSRMVTDQYAKIIDTNRKKTAKLFEESFFNDEESAAKDVDEMALKEMASLVSANPELLQKFMSYMIKREII